MVPRTRIAAFDVALPTQKIIEQAIASEHSRLPIYKGNLNNVEGILYTKDLLKKFGQDVSSLKIEEMLVPAYYVPSSMKISAVLKRLQRKKLHVAVDDTDGVQCACCLVVAKEILILHHKALRGDLAEVP